jgi:hypothetical protein
LTPGRFKGRRVAQAASFLQPPSTSSVQATEPHGMAEGL